MIKRLLNYLRLSYRPQVAVILTLLVAYAMYILFRSIENVQTGAFSYLVLIAALIMNLFFIYVRITDEFKDAEVDRKFFPERPVPSGKVSLADLKVLKYIIIALIFVVGLVFYKAIVEFLIAFALFFLMEKYFFIPRILEKNRILALVTHCPTYAVLLYYMLALYARYTPAPGFDTAYIFIAVWTWLPLLLWELARKTRAPEEEVEGYQTYTTLLGARGVTVLIILALLLHIGGMFLFAGRWDLSRITTISISGLSLGFLLFCLIFFFRLTRKSNTLKSVSELYQFLVYILVIAGGLGFAG